MLRACYGRLLKWMKKIEIHFLLHLTFLETVSVPFLKEVTMNLWTIIDFINGIEDLFSVGRLDLEFFCFP